MSGEIEENDNQNGPEETETEWYNTTQGPVKLQTRVKREPPKKQEKVLIHGGPEVATRLAHVLALGKTNLKELTHK